MDTLKQALMQQYNFSPMDWEKTQVYFKQKVIEAKTQFQQEGMVANELGFVKSGLFRSHYWDDAGRDVTLKFFQKGMVLISPDSFNNRTASKVSITSYEKSELIIITYQDFILLRQEVPIWEEICRAVTEMKNEHFLNRIVQFQTLSASERYETFCQDFPHILLKVPLSHIASYLGMDIATLSRLRSKK